MIELLLPGVQAEVQQDESDSCFTPAYIIDAVTRIVGEIGTDPCWDPRSLVLPVVGYIEAERGECQTWHGPVFCNPPYSNPAPFMARCSAHYAPTIALVKLDPSTAWWRDNVRDCFVCLIDHRIRFLGGYAGGGTAPFPSALIAWRCSLTACKAEALGQWLTSL